MNIDVAGRVRNVQLPSSRPLLPFFEAIVNSMEAIEDAQLKEDGKIEIEVIRDPTYLFEDRSLAEITGFAIKDNGIGFNDENFDAFSTSDTSYKASRGGKGIGRFMWLAAFETVEIDSAFNANGVTKRRRFTFCPRGSGIENHTCVDEAGAERMTTVRLVGFKEKYQKQSPKRLEVIAAFIVEEFLEYFIGPACPVITLRDSLAQAVINLDDFYEREMFAKSSPKRISIRTSAFDVLHVRLYSTHINEHRLYLCAHGRAVIREKLTGRIPNLIRRLQDQSEKEFVYAAYVTSTALDEAVNSDRTGFNLPEDGTTLLGSEMTLSEIRKAVCDECKLFLAPYTAPVADKKRERVQRFVENEGAMYRPILKRLEHKIEAIEPEANNDEIDRQLYAAYHELQVNLREEGKKLMEAPMPGDADFAAFIERFDDYFEKISEVNRADLARYVCHRKAIIEFLRKQLALQDDGKYRREERIHSIIFPRGRTSNEVPFEEHNLWLIDERLAFHAFLSSDQPIRQAPVLQNESQKKPDILVFDKAFAFSETPNVPFSSITILEFKKPLRKEYSDEENPFVQVTNYIGEIRAGKAVTRDGRPLPISENMPFYCYIICDLTPQLRKWAQFSDLQETPDRLGFFGYKRHFNAYCEVISYDKLVADAEKRNKTFFQKLGLP